MKIKPIFAIITTVAIVLPGGALGVGTASVSTVSNSENYVCAGSTSMTGGATTDTSIPGGTNCAVTGEIEYGAKTSSGLIASTTYKIPYCISCPVGYSAVTTARTSNKVPACQVTYTTCFQDVTITKQCQDLPCEGYKLWMPYETGTETRCNTTTNMCEYRCADGYYDISVRLDTSLDKVPTCAACPSNGTCTDGELTCNDGYFKKLTTTIGKYTCAKCVTNGTCIGGTLKCDIGYYEDWALIGKRQITICSQCPSSGDIVGTTATSGAINIAQCYIPAGNTFNDDTGDGEYTDKCFYSREEIALPAVPKE